MLVEKEIIAPGTYWYTDEATGLPRKLDVTPTMTKHWLDQGTAMIAAGLSIPVPYEHDFSAHPMTPKEKLLNNAGEVKEYRLKGDKLFGVVDVQDPAVKSKIGTSIRWTSPWITSFTDGDGKQWNNVISHLALTTRPRITKQAPFSSIAAALSIATQSDGKAGLPKTGICLSKAGLLAVRGGKFRPQYPMAFSLYSGAILAADDIPPKKKDKVPERDIDDNPTPTEDDALGGGADVGGAPPPEGLGTPTEEPGGGFEDIMGGEDVMNPLADAGGDIEMEELLCDLLQALGVPMPDESNENEFKRHLYEAAMSKIKELTSKGMGEGNTNMPDQNQPPGANPHTSQPQQQNPLIQQEQQPMYMSLDDIKKLEEPLRTVALAMYNETTKAKAKATEADKVLNSLRDAKLAEENKKRANRIALLGKLAPRAKPKLEALVAQPSMALSMGEGGAVVDPMAETLAILEQGLADMPRLLTASAADISLAAQPTDGDMLSEEQTDELADRYARNMGCPPVKKAV